MGGVSRGGRIKGCLCPRSTGNRPRGAASAAAPPGGWASFSAGSALARGQSPAPAVTGTVGCPGAENSRKRKPCHKLLPPRGRGAPRLTLPCRSAQARALAR